MITVKGVKSQKPVKVDLSKFFDEPHSATVRALPVTARAKIQELTSSGIRYATQQKKKELSIESIEQTMTAETTMEVRDVKLEYGVIDHDIEGDDGVTAKWGKELWNALDEADPEILQTVIEKITDLSYPDAEDDADPTSPAKSGRK